MVLDTMNLLDEQLEDFVDLPKKAPKLFKAPLKVFDNELSRIEKI